MKHNPDVQHEYFNDKCSEAGLKITPQRTIIYEELLRVRDHPSVDTLYKRVRAKLPNISFDTVFRTLASFNEAGIVRLVEGYGELKRFDADLSDHYHLHCIHCGKILDMEATETVQKLKIPNELEKQFKVLSKRVVFEGICRECTTARR
jgi:Fur family peroxide stress response transcriptional regulator